MQPYACILVRDPKDREKLAEAMLATNGRKVKEAPVVAVFAADLGKRKKNDVAASTAPSLFSNVLCSALLSNDLS